MLRRGTANVRSDQKENEDVSIAGKQALERAKPVDPALSQLKEKNANRSPLAAKSLQEKKRQPLSPSRHANVKPTIQTPSKRMAPSSLEARTTKQRSITIPRDGAELLSQRHVAKDVEARYIPDALEGLDDVDLTTELVAHDDLSGSMEDDMHLSLDSILDAPKLKTELFEPTVNNDIVDDFDTCPSYDLKDDVDPLGTQESKTMRDVEQGNMPVFDVSDIFADFDAASVGKSKDVVDIGDSQDKAQEEREEETPAIEYAPPAEKELPYVPEALLDLPEDLTDFELSPLDDYELPLALTYEPDEEISFQDDDVERFLQRLPTGDWLEIGNEEPDYNHIPYSNFSVELELSTQLSAVN
ncbi:hypothetical protein BCR43DRAFT_481433 [Syncephalastrum racemosum]|uniref:Uncharacterized protein n=1 Tax=Syncephalastrum racemosum TaxID=13706 RepID=A0A1X2HS03_SYNRA|nr:hypothetical protein BCR43DRAFT_481433 [Syncephalastrum racemosum]